MRLLAICAVLMSQTAFAQNWAPAPVSLSSKWGKTVNPSNAWQQYPRPQMQRSAWMNLNGLWNYAITTKGQPAPTKFDGTILVPFCVESSLSGVGKPLLPSQELWYQRQFTLPTGSNWAGKDLLLHFDAVDWEATLWVNGKLAGSHKGGSDPFHFNITPHLKAGGQQEIVLRVWDPTDTDLQARGKQVLQPKGIWYTAVSGIWQTVWLEPRSKKSISSFEPVPNIDRQQISFKTTASGTTGAEKLRVIIKHKGKLVKDTIAAYQPNLAVTIPQPALWTPNNPNLYQVEVALQTGNTVHDRFNSYFAMRKISLGDDQYGYKRLMLNNEPLFHYGPLDQGWWPEGLLTPPSDEAMLFDMVKMKEVGFNMIRKHIKVEPSRYYYYADTMGLLLWQDMPSGFAGPGPSHVAADAKEDWKRPAESARQFEKEWKAIMDHLRFFPSIVMWVPLNEGWGQYDTKRIAELTKNYDTTRLVDAPSGWADRGVGDVNDAHQYPGPGMEPPSENKGRAIVLGEFGGLGLVVNNHIWDPNKRNWGYKTYHDPKVLINEYKELMYNLQGMIPRGLAAAVYTQTTDVEGEVNGFLTYDREKMKIPESLLKQLHEPLYQQSEGTISFVNKTSETAPDQYQLFVGQLPAGWVSNTASVSFNPTSKPVALKKGESAYAYMEFDASKTPDALGVKLYGFGDAKIYLNGTLVWEEDKIRTKRHYDDINLTNKINLLKPGTNRIAIECVNATQETDFNFSVYRLDK